MTGMELKTARLLLRLPRQGDFEAYAAYYADAETARFVGGQMSREKAWRHFAALVGHWTLRGFGIWAVEEIASREFAGCIGLWRPEGWPELEVGYWLTREVQGKGYATEAALAARDYAFQKLGANTLVSYIHPDNLASKKVAERMGARFEETIDFADLEPHCVFRHPGPSDQG